MTKEKFYEEERKLIEKAKGGDRKAMEDLMDRYEPLFRKLCAGETRMDWEDIRQDLAVSFLEGVRAFTPERGTYFPYYIRQRLYWEKVHLVERMMRRRSVELQSLAGIENIADESTGGRDHLEVLKEIKEGKRPSFGPFSGREGGRCEKDNEHEPRFLLSSPGPPLRRSPERKGSVLGHGEIVGRWRRLPLSAIR